MTGLRTRLERHAMLAYALLTILISWGCLALTLGAGAFPASAEELESVSAGLAILAGPTLAALWAVSFAVTTVSQGARSPRETRRGTA